MGARLQPCTECARHIRSDEAACPFCGASMPAGFGESTRPVPTGPVLSRAAILFASATAVVACSSSSSTPPGSTDSGSAADSHVDGPVALYGPAPVDSGPEASPDAGSDAPFDGPVALYGPAPVDSGNG
jgi:hypothetical protein